MFGWGVRQTFYFEFNSLEIKIKDDKNKQSSEEGGCRICKRASVNN